MSRGEDYAPILCQLVVRTSAAVQIAAGERGSVLAWIPRSLIHGADEIGLEARPLRIRFTLRIMRWKALELGLVSETAAAATGTLFPPTDNDPGEGRARRELLPDAPSAKERAKMAIAFTQCRDYNPASKECLAVLANIRAGRTIFTPPDRLTLTRLGHDTLEAAKKAS